MTTVRVAEHGVLFENLESHDVEVVEYFTEQPVESLGERAVRAMSVGVRGLRAMGTASQMDAVETEFLAMSQRFTATLSSVESRLNEKVDRTFDPERAESVSARLSQTIARANSATTATIDDAKAQLQRLIADSFNPELTTSCVFQIIRKLDETRAELDRSFDPAIEGSHLSRLVAEMGAFFGEDGIMGEVINSQVGPVKDEVLKALQSLRDTLVSQVAAAQVRRKTTLSGPDFEADVEALLRSVARAYGDVVERVGAQAGETGASKTGDFVVQLREGPRFVVEAKDLSSPVTLRGDHGIMATLRASMLNRASSFAIGVLRDPAGFPKEVGTFNEYDGDKILCVFGPDGELLEAAYRWARATLLLGLADRRGVDVAAVEAGIAEARRALREISRIEGKARAIAKGADEIQGLVSFQLRRASVALDQAADGIAIEVRKAS
jgi:hypothetical protein